ncbi:MAG: LysR family transcriptional regulator [Rhodobacteraceae bacterium]|nr:LysR family transcriptional regulator [Paracoccaceae bacterium]
MLTIAAITLRQLRALRAVAQHGSLTAAGRALGLTTPAIHNQIKLLEAEAGTALLRRDSDGAGSELTAAGMLLMDAAAQMDATLSQAMSRVDAIGKGFAGRVMFGVVSTGKYFAPRLVKMLNTIHPDIDIVLHVGNREDILREMERMRFDLVVMGRPPRDPDISDHLIGPHPHGIVAAPDHPLAGRSALSAADFAREVFICREEGSGTRILMTRYLDRINDGRPFKQVEMGTNETIKQAVIAGLGIAFLSLHTVADELRMGLLTTLNAPQLPIERFWFLVHSTRRPLQPAAATIAKTVLGLNGSFLPSIAAATARETAPSFDAPA